METVLQEGTSTETSATPPGTSAAAAAQHTRSYFRPELNSLRFVAFLLVFYDHAQPVGWIGRFSKLGASGVPVFFLLSAYLICTLLLREQQTVGTFRVGFFFVRRILRIWPLYFVALLGGYVLGHVLPDVLMPRRMLVYFVLLVGNVYVARYGWTNSPSSTLWSLSIEEQFYLVIPFVGRFLGRRGLQIVCWAALTMAVLTLLRFDLRHETNNDVVWANSFVCFQFFALGGLIASARAPGLKGKQLPKRAGLLLGGLLCFLVQSRADLLHKLHLPALHTVTSIFVAVGTVAVFFAFLNYPARPRSVPAYLGVISYGLYVFHP